MRQKGWIVGLPVLVLLGLAACGGGGGEASSPAPATPPGPTPPATGIGWTSGVYPASSSLAAQCQAPRSGTNPATGRAYPDVAGSALAEKHFLRAWTHELYLWSDEVPDRDPATVADVRAYFDLLKTPAIQPSGRAKDEFHFTYDSAQYYAMSQSGTATGYGIAWDVVSGVPPRRVVVQFVQPGSPAALAGIGRGAELRSVDGINVVTDTTSGGITLINNGAFSPVSGSVHQLQFADRGTGTLRSAALTARAVSFDAVPLVRTLTTTTGKVGYLLFNDHTASSEQVLIQAVQQLAGDAVQDLVLDLRYNGGGYLDIASELAYMIAGSARTAGKTFERQQFNSQYATTNPVTGEPLTPIPFYSTAQGFSAATGTPLPTLNLARVFVLTSDGTCSASESIINGLRGAGVQVLQIGGTTCGKPYGFYPRDNCGTTYFSVQFRGVNQLGFGDYAEGFSATRTTGPAQANLPGCPASDDFSRDLGDVNEGQLRVALAYREGGFCIAAAEAPEAAQAPAVPAGPELVLPRAPWRGNRFLR